MAVVKYAEAIEYVSGAMSKPVVKSGHKHGKYVIGTHRKAATENPNCTRLYIAGQDRYERTTPLSNHERAIRLRFTTVAAMVNERKEDLTKVTQDQAAFLAQKDTAGGKKTMKAYLWYVCGQEYDSQQG